jgi:hypothetical protein
MDYGKLIRDAWAATWRYRFLWVLGLFAGGAAGASGGGQSQWRMNGDDVERWSPRAVEYTNTVGTWLAANWVFLVVGAGLIGLACVALSFIAQGGMAQATADLATGRGGSLRQAWRAGLHLCWRWR